MRNSCVQRWGRGKSIFYQASDLSRNFWELPTFPSGVQKIQHKVKMVCVQVINMEKETLPQEPPHLAGQKQKNATLTVQP